MKRLYLAAPAALLTFILSTQTPVDAAQTKRSGAAEYKVNSFSRSIAGSAKRVASSMRSVGYCYRGVKRALKHAGVTLTGSSAFMAKRQLESDSRFQKVALSKLKVGDILVHGKSKAHPHGHIAVYLGNGKEASDHVGKLITGRRYGGTTVFRPSTTYIAKATATTTTLAAAVKTTPAKYTGSLRTPVIAASSTAPNPASPSALAATIPTLATGLPTSVTIPAVEAVAEPLILSVAETGTEEPASPALAQSADLTTVVSTVVAFAQTSLAGLFSALI